MADFTVPATWTHDGNDGSNQSVFYVTADHTPAETYLIIFSRKKSVVVNGNFTKPSYRIRIIRSFVDADGNPLAAKAVIDTNMSWPFAADATKVKAMVTLNGAIFGDIELASDIVDSQRIPLSA